MTQVEMGIIPPPTTFRTEKPAPTPDQTEENLQAVVLFWSLVEAGPKEVLTAIALGLLDKIRFSFKEKDKGNPHGGLYSEASQFPDSSL